MKTCVILNPEAGSTTQGEALAQWIERHDDVERRETTAAGDAVEMARKALDDGFDRIVAAGGDGTVNEVVNGIMAHGGACRLAILPLGTGNDLARTLGLPERIEAALEVLDGGTTRAIDVIEVETDGETTWAINAAAGGFSGQVDEAVTSEMKQQWGPVAYLLAAARTLPDVLDYETFIAYDEVGPERIDALNIVVANGRTVAGGKRVAPLANPEDGLLDVVVVRACSLPQMTKVAAHLATGNYLNSEHVVHRRARRVRVESHPGMWFNVDGELLTKEAVTFTVLPGRMTVYVGPDYTASPPLL